VSTAQTRSPNMSVAAEISTRMVQLLSAYTGRGPTKARTTMNNNLIVVVTDDTLTTAERSLVAAGQIDAVLEMRRRFHDVLKAEAVALVEQLTHRKVRSFLSDISPADNVGAHVFVLEPLPDASHLTLADSPAAAGHPAA
jgi:uncharacterized protein YbcI